MFLNSKLLRILFITGLAGSLSACASQPEDIQSSFVSNVRYQKWSCDQLTEEVASIEGRVSALSGQLEKKAGDDQAQMAIGLILFWPALFLLEGGDGTQAAEYARLKGEREAIDRVSRLKNCSSIRNLEAPDMQQQKIFERLKELKKLKDQGLINDSEFKSKKSELLEKL